MRIREFYLLLASLLVVGCGGVTVEKPKDTKIELDQPTDSHCAENQDGETCESGEILTRERTLADPAVDVEVDVDVKVTVGGGSATSADKAIYSPRMLTWRDAMDHAPEGYRLASRTEAVALFDAGYFDELATNGSGVWTATDAHEPDNAWQIDLSTGFLFPIDKALRSATLWVKTASE